MARAIGHVTIVGLGLIGSSIARAVKERLPQVTVTGHDASADVRVAARALGFCDTVADDPAAAVAEADLVILAVPVGRMADAGSSIAPGLRGDAIISDVGSSKSGVADALAKALPGHLVIPAHPVAGTENSGPAAGFASLFEGRWCIVTPPAGAPGEAVAAVTGFWQALGAKVETMEAAHHDRVLAVTSHLPHLIAYTIVGTASELEEVTESEVIKYSAGGFRDFTRIAASDPVMWRDVFLANKEAVLETLQRFNEDLTVLQQAIRRGDGGKLEEWFTRTRAIRRSIIEQGQDDAAPDFGRKH
ncbi:prephenate/arogenate dehydrogenase family protein [Sphingopyxis sp.]|uniref:prephenate/arogenate dehydrogenase family protein n=1 Tax=Sphingopyxis sp. TaxID=1908224 RepID=UPI002609BCC4|nr:prephenate/arogenate dehydrogenase family protein [Sphingopyxis sp.]MCW0197806.1 prephenate/arogenate dehydrogenase family protein [Sphingopyxis sp.]